MGDKTAILFQLGPANDHRNWLDYLQYGFDEGDVAELVQLAGDEALNNAEADSDAVWVPLHAWRALGQLRSPEAVAPLIALFEYLRDDDWALGELGKVVGMAGESAIDPLAAYMSDRERDEFARAMAFDGLEEVVKTQPECRERVLENFRDYMSSPDSSNKTLNGLLMAKLLDLNAVELVDDMRRLFEMDCVDITAVGDMEDVEIEFGLRSERATPPPDFRQLYGLAPELPADSDDLYAVVDYYLDRYGNDDSVLNCTELDGYFAAIACAPQLVRPSRWLPALWGGEDLSPAWESMDEANEFISIAMSMYNNVIDDLNQDNFQPLFLESDVKGRTYTIVDEWCHGFLRGVSLWGGLNKDDKSVLEQSLIPIRLLATKKGFEELDSMHDDAVELAQAKIEPAVLTLYRHFRSWPGQAPSTFVREIPKVGRNDPCPCGSGKKFKRCCLH